MAKMNRKTTNNNKGTKGKKKPQFERKDYRLKVTRAFEGRYGILFDLEINDVKVYGLRVCETSDGEAFVGWPQHKGKDGHYYSHAWAYLDEGQTKDVLDQVAALLTDEDEEDEDE